MGHKFVSLVLLLSSVGFVLAGMHVRTFVRSQESPGGGGGNSGGGDGGDDDTCESLTCLDDSDCTSVDENMKCVFEDCMCKKGFTRYGNTCRERGKTVGEDCVANDDCLDVSGYCDPDTNTCACASTYKEWRGACFRGYKATLGDSIDIGVDNLDELSFFVTETNDPFQLGFTDIDGDDDSFRFYEDNSYTSDGVDYASLELEIVLNGAASGGVQAPTDVNLWKVSWGESDFTLKIFKYEADENTVTGPLSTNFKDRFNMDPNLLTVTRDQGLQDFIIYPLSLQAKIGSKGSIGSPCSSDNQCKVFHSVCVGGKCGCEDTFVEDSHGNCVEGVTTPGGHCSSSSECLLPNSVCASETCECKEGYFEDNTGQCSDEVKDVGEPCTTNNECSGEHTVCDTTCRCEDSYTEVDGKCYKEAELGEPCSCKGQCVNPNTYCKLENTGTDELGVCSCLPTHCEYNGVCYKGYIVYPKTTDLDNTYPSRKFTAPPGSQDLSFQVVPSGASPGSFSVDVINDAATPDRQEFNFQYEAVGGSTGEIVYDVNTVSNPIAGADSSVNFLTHIGLVSGSTITTDSMQMTMPAGIGSFNTFEVEVDADSLEALRFCPLSDAIVPERVEAGDTCLPDEGCPGLSNSECTFQQVCECVDEYINFYGECIEQVPTGSDCVTLLQCVNSFCADTGKCV